MQKCILEGHRPAKFDGKGEHEGKKFEVCTECGLTLREVKEDGDA